MCSPAAFAVGLTLMGVGATFIVSGYINLKVVGQISSGKQLKERNQIAEKLIKTSNRRSAQWSFA